MCPVERYATQGQGDDTESSSSSVLRTPLFIQSPAPQRFTDPSSIFPPEGNTPPRPLSPDSARTRDMSGTLVEPEDDMKQNLAQITNSFHAVDNKLDSLERMNEAGFTDLGTKIDELQSSVRERIPFTPQNSAFARDTSAIQDSIQLEVYM